MLETDFFYESLLYENREFLVVIFFVLFVVLLVPIKKRSRNLNGIKRVYAPSFAQSENIDSKKDSENPEEIENVDNTRKSYENNIKQKNVKVLRRKNKKNIRSKALLFILCVWFSFVCYILWFDVLWSTDWGIIVFLILTSVYIVLIIKGIQLFARKKH